MTEKLSGKDGFGDEFGESGKKKSSMRPLCTSSHRPCRARWPGGTWRTSPSGPAPSSCSGGRIVGENDEMVKKMFSESHEHFDILVVILCLRRFLSSSSLS